MKTLRAAQLLYTRVEAAYSPVRRDGFQTVYKSDSLSAADVSMIEKRVRQFQPPMSSTVRRQFFTLPNGAVVLTRTTRLDTHLDIIDKAGRAGAFLAHCFVVSVEDFGLVDNNPFVLFDQGRYVRDAEDMVETFRQATGVAELAEFSLEDLCVPLQSTWSGPEACQGVALALHASSWSQAGKSVLLVGSEGDIDEALRTILYLVPKAQRLFCTFDTCIDGSPTASGLYWAVGSTTRQAGTALTLIDAAARRVLSPVQEKWPEDDLYLAWLQHISTREDFATAVQHVGAIQHLSEAFTQRSEPLLDFERHGNAYQDFEQFHREHVTQCYKRALVQPLGERLATMLYEDVTAQVEFSMRLGIAAQQQFAPATLSALALDWLISRRPVLKNRDRTKLQHLARQGRNIRLLHLTATLGTRVDVQARDEALRAMDTATFQCALKQCVTLVDPEHFVTPVHLELLVTSSQLIAMSAAQLLALLESLLQIKAGAPLAPLAPYVQHLDHKSLAAVEKLVHKRTDIPPAFQKAIHQQREQLGPGPRWFHVFRK